MNQKSQLKGIEGFMASNKELPQLDTVKLLLLEENNQPRSWEYTTLIYAKITSQLFFEVVDNMSQIEIIQTNVLNVVCKHCRLFNTIGSLIRKDKSNKLTKYQDHDNSCCLSENDKVTILKSYNFKYKDITIEILVLFYYTQKEGCFFYQYVL